MASSAGVSDSLLRLIHYVCGQLHHTAFNAILINTPTNVPEFSQMRSSREHGNGWDCERNLSPYTIEPERLHIVAVMHGKRKPGYWAGRLET